MEVSLVSLSGSEHDDPPIFPYQRIKDNPSTHDLGQPSGAEPFREISSSGPPQDNLDDIFRRALDLGTPEYEHDLTEYIRHGYPSLYEHYDRVQELGRGPQQECDLEKCACHAVRCDGKTYGKVDPVRQAQETAYFEEQRKEKERRTRIVDKIKTLHVTKREDLDILKPKELFDYQCYNPKCDFATNNKAEYEKHGVIKHAGKPCYPGKIDLKFYGCTAQGRKWEI